MPQYLKLAEKIYSNLKISKGFSDDPVEDLNNLMIELRHIVKDTNFKMLHHYIDFEELLMNSQNVSINIDISILPKSKNKDEYILWLASFVEKVTIPTKKIKQPIKDKVIQPSYCYDDLGNIVDKTKKDEDAIVLYFQYKETTT